MQYYVYQLIDPFTNLPFYIGKGKSSRCFKHLKETKENTENYKKWACIEGIRNKGGYPLVEKVFVDLSEEEAYNKEKELIEFYGRRDLDVGGILTNICIDSRPPKIFGRVWTSEQKAIIGSKNKEHARRRKEQGIPGPKAGKTISGESKEKIRQSRLGTKASEETKQKMSRSHKNHIKSLEHRKNLNKSVLKDSGFTEDIILDIRSRYNNGEDIVEICNHYQYLNLTRAKRHKGYFLKIATKKVWRYIV